MEKLKKVVEFGKIDYLGTGRRENLVTIELELKEREEGKLEFSCCGNVWNRVKSDILCGGQCLDEIKDYIDTPLFVKIYRLWKLYHLNTMHAGTKKQEDFLIKNGYEDCGNRYKEACDFLKKNNLYYDNGVGFGCSWQYWKIPEEDLEEIKKIIEG